MPELPEVEFAALCLRRWLTGRRVARAAAEPTRLLRGVEPRQFARQLGGRTLQSVERRGKYLLLDFDGDVGLLAHLGMTGKFVRRPVGQPVLYGHARLELDDGTAVHLRDPRKFGRLSLGTPGGLRELDEIAGLGPDAAGLTPGQLGERLGRTRRPVKIALMDQKVVAGLGNIHAAEALFRAGLSPRRRADRLGGEALVRLAGAIRETIEFALEQMPAPEAEDVEYVEEPGAENPFLVYGKAGEPCPRCGTRLRSFTQGGRTTHYCARCQR